MSQLARGQHTTCHLTRSMGYRSRWVMASPSLNATISLLHRFAVEAAHSAALTRKPSRLVAFACS
eukprot:1020669-Amphidinium_carterae.2